MIYLKPDPRAYLTSEYLIGLILLISTWITASFVLKKYSIVKQIGLWLIFKRILSANFVSLAVISIFVAALQVSGYSRMIFFGTILLATLVEFILANLDYFLIHTVENATDIINPPPKAMDIRKARTMPARTGMNPAWGCWKEPNPSFSPP